MSETLKKNKAALTAPAVAKPGKSEFLRTGVHREHMDPILERE